MKKAILILAVGLLAFLLLVPRFLVGSRIEAQLVDRLLDMVPAEAYGLLQITLEDFQPGWFSSQARVSANLSELVELDGESVGFEVALDILHGPVMFTSQGLRLGLAYADVTGRMIGFDTPELQELGEISGTEPVYYMQLGFDGVLNQYFALSRFDARAPDASISLQGAHGSMALRPDNSSSFDVAVDEFAMTTTADNFEAIVTGISAYATLDAFTRYGAPGESGFAIGRITISGPESATIENLYGNYQLAPSAADSAYLDGAMSLGVERVDAGFPVTSASWVSEIRHLNISLLERYATLAVQSQALGGENAQAASDAFLANAFELALEAAREQLEFNNIVEANAFGGDHRLELRINWAGLPGLASIDAINIDDAIDALTVTLGINADHSALLRSPVAALVDQYQQEGLLMLDNGRVLTDATLVDGVLQVNGEVLPLDDMLGVSTQQ